jgi:hypothetical protein
MFGKSLALIGNASGQGAEGARAEDYLLGSHIRRLNARTSSALC